MITILEIGPAIIVGFMVLCVFFLYSTRSNKTLFVGILLSLSVGIVSITTYPPGTGDTMWNVPVGLSLIKEGNIDLNEYSDLIESRNSYGIWEFGGKYYNYWPIGGSIIPLPFIFIGHLLFGEDLSLIQLFSSKMMFMVNVFFFYLLCWTLSRNINISIILSIIFAFATPNLHVLSGALWTHGGAELMITLTLLALLYGRDKQNDIAALSALFLFLGYLARPTTALLAPVVFIYLALTHRRSAVKFIGLWGACLGGYVLWSMATFGEPVPPYYASSRLSLDAFSIALAGQLISPNRGLFVFAPFVFFSIAGMHKAIKDHDTDLIFKLLPIFVASYVIILAMFPHWWGGWSYGPRLYTDLMPIFVIYLYWIINTFRKGDNKYWRYLFIIIIAYCVIIQSFAVIDPHQKAQWNGRPASVDYHPDRIWDWSDMQILRFVKDPDSAVLFWSSSLAITGDWNGDGRDAAGLFRPNTAGLFRPSGGGWHFNHDNAGRSEYSFAWGDSSFVPVAGDWNGDGKATAGLFRPSDGRWYFNYDNVSGSEYSFVWGDSSFIPVVGDWNGDGKDTAGLFRPSDGRWYFNYDNAGPSEYSFVWGDNSFIPIAGDWNGDGKDTAGLFRPSDGRWYFNYDNAGPSEYSFVWGDSGFIPVAGDWNGDGKDTAGLFRPSDIRWFFNYDNAGPSEYSFVWA